MLVPTLAGLQTNRVPVILMGETCSADFRQGQWVRFPSYKTYQPPEFVPNGAYVSKRNLFCNRPQIDIFYALSEYLLSDLYCIRHPNTTSCIIKFIEGKLGCSPNIMGRDRMSAANVPCYSGHHLTELATLSRLLYEADDTAIYDLTGDGWMSVTSLKWIKDVLHNYSIT